MFTIRANTSAAADQMAKVAYVLEKDFVASMDDMGRFSVKVIRRKMPVKTGALSQSLTSKLTKTANGYEITFDASAKAVSDGKYYANMVDQGTKPHAIYPKNASVLRFIDREGNVRYAPYIDNPAIPTHPGAKAALYTEKSMPEIERHAHTVVKQLARKILSGQ